MNVIGIICEYNPFHNGHKYHLKKVKELFPDSLVILVLNGYFLERGEVSVLSKEDKVKISLEMGIDLVVELPFVFGTQSADIFASTSIRILEELKCDYVVFGSECNDLDKLNRICDYTINNSQEYNEKVKKLLDNGDNYPTAMAKAIDIEFDFNPNDLLGISYIKAIKDNNYNIKPITIKRTTDYLDIKKDDNVISATNIRNKLLNNTDIRKYIPKKVYPLVKKVSLNDFFELIRYKIISDKDLSIYLDVDEGIENRLKKIINECNSVDDLIEKTKSKRYTYNKIRRMLIHILIGFTKDDNKKISLEYIKILGFNAFGKKYLNGIKKEMSIPTTPLKNSLVYLYELKSAQIYDLITKKDAFSYENSNKPLKIK